jgi:small-conductance mechanosensitive channel
MMNRWRPEVVLLATLTLTGCGLVSAQETSPPPSEQATQTETTTPEAPGAAETFERAEATLRELRTIETSLANIEVVEQIELELGPTVEEIREATEQLQQGELDTFGFRQLERARLDWVRYESRIDGWRARVGKQASARQESSDRLAGMRETWEATRDRFAGMGGVEPAVEQTEAVLEQIEQVESQVEERMSRLLSLQGALGDAAAEIDDAMSRLDAAQDSARARLLLSDSPPLWEMLSRRADEPTVIESLRAAFRENSAAVDRFLKEDRLGPSLHLLWFVSLLVPLVYLRRRQRDWLARQPSLRRTARILDRPASAAFVLASLIARWSYRPMPDAYLQILIFLILVPLIRVLAKVLPPELRTPIYLFGFVFAIDQVQDLTGNTLGGRLLLLIVGVGVLAMVPWMSRTGRLSVPSLGRWATVLPILAWSAFAAFVVSVVSNVVGNVGLADLMSELVLSGTFVSFALYAGFLVAEGVVGVVLLSPLVRPVRSIDSHREPIRAWMLRVVQIAMVVWWCWAMLGIARLRGPVTDALSAIFLREWSVGSVTISLGHVAAGLFALWIALLISRILRFVLEEDVMARLTLPRGVPSTISLLVRFGTITIGVLFAAAVAGFDLSQFAFIVGALGVGIGFGLQNVVSNFVSGLILIFERPIRVGDTVQTATLFGEVRSIGIRSSRVRTFDGAEVIVPNGSLIAGEVTNWTLSDRLRRIELLVGVAYGTDVHLVESTLLEVVKQHSKVLTGPAPTVLFRGFGDSSLDFSLRYWTAEFENWLSISSEVAMAVHDALKDSGIQIPFPQRDLHLRSVDPAVAGAVRPRAVDADPKPPDGT